jgi:tryptophan-rich sensory protein
MFKYLHYIISPLFYIGVALSGRVVTAQGVTTWYPSIVKPSYTPSGSVIGAVWTLIFILSAISLILFINSGRGNHMFWPTIGIFVLNGILNAVWSYLFFAKHYIGLAFIDAVLIGITIGLIIIMVWPYSKASALLLLPYLCWVSFASYLTYAIYTLN